MHNCTTCVFYSPPKAALDHDGVEKNPRYDYNIELASHMCLHKSRKREGIIAACDFMVAQKQCPLYEAKEKVLDRAETKYGTTIELTRRLTKFNFVTYSVFEIADDEPTLLYSLDEHQTDQAMALVSERFDKIVEETSAVSLEIEEETSSGTSYLQRVMTS